jgi:hypothetical protein
MSVDAGESVLSRINPERRVSEGDVSLTSHTRQVRATVPIDAVRHSGRDEDDPGSAHWYYLRDKKLLIFDLGGEFE